MQRTVVAGTYTGLISNVGGRHSLVCSLPAGSKINVTAHNRGNSNYKENSTLSWKDSSNTQQSRGRFMLTQHDE